MVLLEAAERETGQEEENKSVLDDDDDGVFVGQRV